MKDVLLNPDSCNTHTHTHTLATPDTTITTTTTTTTDCIFHHCTSTIFTSTKLRTHTIDPPTSCTDHLTRHHFLHHLCQHQLYLHHSLSLIDGATIWNLSLPQTAINTNTHTTTPPPSSPLPSLRFSTRTGKSIAAEASLLCMTAPGNCCFYYPINLYEYIETPY